MLHMFLKVINLIGVWNLQTQNHVIMARKTVCHNKSQLTLSHVVPNFNNAEGEPNHSWDVVRKSQFQFEIVCFAHGSFMSGFEGGWCHWPNDFVQKSFRRKLDNYCNFLKTNAYPQEFRFVMSSNVRQKKPEYNTIYAVHNDTLVWLYTSIGLINYHLY